MGINPASMNFHAVHQFGKKTPSPTNSTEEISPRQIIVRFISRNDMDNVGRTGGRLRIPLTRCSRMHFLYQISPKRTQRSHTHYIRHLDGPENNIKLRLPLEIIGFVW